MIDQGLTATAGETVTLGGAWSNAAGATITASGATLNLGGYWGGYGGWTNTGTITATNSTVNLGGLFTLAGLGMFNHNGATVNLTGTLDDTGTDACPEYDDRLLEPGGWHAQERHAE